MSSGNRKPEYVKPDNLYSLPTWVFAEAFTWVSEPLIEDDMMGKAVGRMGR